VPAHLVLSAGNCAEGPAFDDTRHDATFVLPRDHAGMTGPTAEQMDAEHQLMLARRRAGQCCPFSPAWDAAMEAIHECEWRVIGLDRHAAEHPWPGIGEQERPSLPR
jgi:hypothetical protein